MKTFENISRRAFTMLELIFVIVIVGILSYFATASFQRNTVVEAADQIVSHIRYTQHLAMIDDRFDATDATYYRERWHIHFSTDSSANGNLVYWIISDKNQNGALGDIAEYAKDPLNTAIVLSGDSSLGNNRNQNLDLTKKYGITTVTNNCAPGAGNGRIFFDELGRPYNDTTFPATATHQNRITAICTIVITGGTQTRTIEISPETGYVRHY